VADARTESVAAPVARAAGVLVPRLLAFDDSRTLVDRPYSIWERVHGETLGLLGPARRLMPETWSAVGRQLAMLHTRVHECTDPLGWLDHPDRELNLAERFDELASGAPIDRSIARDIARWIEGLKPAVAAATAPCFLHNDIHDMNLMSARDGSLLALIDWGDAGWGDPILEFAQVPLVVVPFVMTGYEAEAPGRLGDGPEARILWDKLDYALRALPEDPHPIEELRRMVRAGDARWRQSLFGIGSHGA
jgi:aminoglycoside phosphotransferase (APT) family kinase protein